MPTSVDIDDRALGTIAIADADGEQHSYTVELIALGMSYFAVGLQRCDTQAAYRVRLVNDKTHKWECDCPAEKYRKRGQDHCKHIQAITLFRGYLLGLLKSAGARQWLTRFALTEVDNGTNEQRSAS